MFSLDIHEYMCVTDSQKQNDNTQIHFFLCSSTIITSPKFHVLEYYTIITSTTR